MFGFDLYERRARLAPALLVVFPIAADIAAWFPNGVVGWAGFFSLFTLSGGTLLMAQVARELGKRIEPSLFSRWGGNPASAELRHRGSEPVAVSRRHVKLAELMGDFVLPTADEEQQDPAAADVAYDHCVLYLRSQTRNRSRFELLHHDNCSYGFWRNLFGLRVIGSVLSVVGASAMGLRIVADGLQQSSPLTYIVFLVNLLLALGWLFFVTPAPIHTAARGYAQRLMEAIEML